MYLAFSGARTNGAPGNQITYVLRRNHVEKLAASGQSEAVNLNQQLACNTQTFVNPEAFVEVRVIDQALPADGGARFLEVNAHHNFQRASVLFALLHEAACVFDGGDRIVNRTRTNHYQQAVVGTGNDVVNALAGVRDQRFHSGAANREKAD